MNAESHDFSLAPDSIAIWVFDTDLEAPDDSLSESERARADRYRFDRDRRRFLARHVRLRAILGGYVGRDPSALEFDVGEFGKPELRVGGDCSILRPRFNLSHSSGLALLAVSLEPIGVDLERVRSDSSWSDLARAYFTETEQAWIASAERRSLDEAFFQIWTGKEACLKAIGVGLSIPTKSVEVRPGLFEGEPGDARVSSDQANAKVASTWEILHLRPRPGFLAAVAFSGRVQTARLIDWDGRDLPRSR